MPKGFTMTLTGGDKLRQVIASKEKALTEGVDRELTAATLEINAMQKRDIPKDTGTAARSLGFDVKKKYEKRLFSAGAGSQYTPYLEFGTGGLVNVPPGLEDIAIQFKGKGIRRVNMPARPFFFKALFAQKPKLIKNLEDLLKK